MAKNCKPSIIIPDKYSVIVVQNIAERNSISCKIRQNGTIAVVVEEGYVQYQIRTKEGLYSVCDNNAWVQISTGDKVFDSSNLIILNNEEHKQKYLQSGLAVVGQMIFYVPENKYYSYDGYNFVDPFYNKLDKGTYTGTAQDLKNEIDGKLNKGGYEGTAQDLKNSIDGIDSKTTKDVIATTTVGAINAGKTVPVGTNIQKLTELLLNKTFYPTFVDPTFGLTNNAGLREVGSVFNVTLTFNFNRGQILGKLDNGIWNPTMLQDYRAGIATSYLLNGVSGANNSASFNITTVLGNNTLNGSVTYATGVQPKDSKNNNYDSPLSSGTSPIQSTSFEGIYPYFYYKSTSPITPAIMQSAIANGQATKVLASSTGTITIPFAANGEYIAVAYPATSTTKTIWYVNALDNGDIPGGILGATNTLPCTSPTGLWNNVNFKIHVSPGVLTRYEAVQLKNS